MWWAKRSTRHWQTSRSCSSDSGNSAWSWSPESVHCSALKSSSSAGKLMPAVFMWLQITSRQFWIGQNQRIERSWRVFLVSWTTTESSCVVWQRSRQFCINWQEPTRSGSGESSIQKPSSFWKRLWQNFPFWVSPTHVTSLSWILMRRMLQSELSWVRFRRAGREPSLSLINLWIKLSDPIVRRGRSCWLWWCSRITFATTCWDELSRYRLTMQA